MIARLNQLAAFLVWLCLLAAAPIAVSAQTFGSPAPKRDADIERLQRQLEGIETELKQLKQQAPREGRTIAEPTPVKLPVTEPVRSAGQEATREQRTHEFRGELDYLSDRIGVLNQKLDQRVGMSMYLTTEFEAFQRGKAEFAGAKMELFPAPRLTTGSGLLVSSNSTVRATAARSIPTNVARLNLTRAGSSTA